MSDFDCECGFEENDPICKCNGAPGYENLGGGRKVQNTKQPKNFIAKKFAQLDEPTQVALLFVLDVVLILIAVAFALA